MSLIFVISGLLNMLFTINESVFLFPLYRLMIDFDNFLCSLTNIVIVFQWLQIHKFYIGNPDFILVFIGYVVYQYEFDGTPLMTLIRIQ